MKILVSLAATSVFLAFGCSGTGTDQPTSPEVNDPIPGKGSENNDTPSQAPVVDEGTSEAATVAAAPEDHPDFIRKKKDPEHYRVNRGEGIQPFSICGTDDKQYVNSYTGNLGVSVAYVNTYKGAVGVSETSISEGPSVKFCTGTLIANDLFLTASHCVDSSTKTEYVAFNYERKANSTEVLPQQHFKITGIVEDGLGGLDYAILRLAGNPGATFGVTKTNKVDPTSNAILAIIQHPGLKPKQIEAGHFAGLSGDYISYGDIDTEGGSSGSGVLNAAGELVGVHTLGGCTATGGRNFGVRMSKIAAASAIIN
ncbi:trypsin-like serine peptidase [Pendulispora albinea]|uniref:Serine protease n=1 Tax=Pendulispora albinea TaxID=2741071 RepID=A0ABZ2M2Y0_9BACT